MTEKISEEEQALFRASLGDVTLLRTEPQILPVRTKAKPKIKKTLELKELLPISSQTPTFVSSASHLEFSHSGVQPKTLRQLRQGKLPIQGELDLHGLSVAAAEHQVLLYLTRSQALGKKVIKIIHGKGNSDPTTPPALKNAINQLLPRCTQVLAFCSAPVNQGGTGAVCVLLKKSNIPP